MKHGKKKIGILLFLAALCSLPSYGETKRWLGHSQLWHISGNWFPYGIPTADDDVIIPQPASLLASNPKLNGINGNATVKSIKIESGASLDLDGKTLSIKSGFTNNGTLTAHTGTVKFIGNSKIAGNTETAFYNIEIDSGKKLTLEQNIKIEGSFSNNGSFTHGGKKAVFDGTASKIAGSTATAFYDIEIDSGKKLTLEQNITIASGLTNKGVFNAGNKTVTLSNERNITITRTTSATDMQFHNVKMESAGGKTLTINGAVYITGDLSLSGSNASSLLAVRGTNGEIYLTVDNSETGSHLHINTDTVKMTNKPYTVGNSLKWEYTRPDQQNQNNWVFAPMDITWTGAAPTDKTKWDKNENWDYKAVPAIYDTVTIPAGKPKPKLTANVKAQSVKIESGATLDLAEYIIETTGSTTAQLRNEGTLQLKGTAQQKAWFESSKIELAGATTGITGTSSVVYYDTSSNAIYAGPYYHVTMTNRPNLDSPISSNTPLNINADNQITVSHNLTITGIVTLNKELKADDVYIASTGNLTTAAEITVKKRFEVGGTAALQNKLKAEIIVINPNKTLTAAAEITVKGGLHNHGTFSTTADVIIENTGNCIIEGQSNDETKTKFKKLICNAPGKTVTFKRKITVESLELKGSSSSRLNIRGSDGAAIYIPSSPDIQDGNDCEYLKIYTGTVKINGGDFRPCYRLNKTGAGGNIGRIDHVDNTENRNGWVFYKTYTTPIEPQGGFINSFVRAGSTELYAVFKTGMGPYEFALSKLTVSNTGGATFNAESTTQPTVYMPHGYPSCTVWKYTLNKPINAEEILRTDMKISIVQYGSDGETYEKEHISDVGIGLISVLFASNVRTIRSFSGEAWLPKLNTVISITKVASSQNVKLYFDADKNIFWYPAVSGVKPFPHVQPLNAVSNGNAAAFSPTVESNTLQFLIPSIEPRFKERSVAEFMFVYDGWLPCPLLKNDSDIFSFDVWKFSVVGTSYQRGGVSVFNNVINPDKGENVSIQLTTSNPGAITIQIMTLDGGIIKTLERAQQSAGAYFYSWDGKNSAGNPVARGLYFIRIAGPNIDEMRKVMVVR